MSTQDLETTASGELGWSAETVNALAAELDLAPRAVRRALDNLVRRGLIDSILKQGEG